MEALLVLGEPWGQARARPSFHLLPTLPGDDPGYHSSRQGIPRGPRPHPQSPCWMSGTCPPPPRRAPRTCAASLGRCLRLGPQTREHVLPHVEVGDQPQSHGRAAPAGRTFPARLSPPGPAAASLLPPPSPLQLLSVLGGPARRIPAPPLPGRSLRPRCHRGVRLDAGHQASPFPGSGGGAVAGAPTGRLSPRLRLPRKRLASSACFPSWLWCFSCRV